MQGYYIEVHKIVRGQMLDEKKFAGTDRVKVIEAAIEFAPEQVRADLRQQLGPVVEGAEPRRLSYESHDRTCRNSAWLRIRPVEVVQ